MGNELFQPDHEEETQHQRQHEGCGGLGMVEVFEQKREVAGAALSESRLVRNAGGQIAEPDSVI